MTLNTYTHLGLEDAADELKRMEDLEIARKELEKAVPDTKKCPSSWLIHLRIANKSRGEVALIICVKYNYKNRQICYD